MDTDNEAVEAAQAAWERAVTEGLKLQLPQWSSLLPMREALAAAQAMRTIPTFVETQNGRTGWGSGTYSECKVAGRIVRVEKGAWDNNKQDWRAVLIFDNGQTVPSAWWYGGITSRPASPVGVEEFLSP